MSVTVPLFLYFMGQMTTYLFISFLSTQVAFFLGFRIIKPITILKVRKIGNTEIKPTDIRFAKWLFIIIGISNIGMQLFSYKLVGIPLFAESRLGIYGESGGINNLLKRLLDVTSQCHIFLTIYFLYKGKKSKAFKVYTYFSVSFILIFSILSGSKGAFMTFGLAYFIYALYSMRWGDYNVFFKIKKFLYKFIFIAVAIATIVILASEGSENPFLFILLRIGQSGDVYFMAYPNDVIDKIPTMDWFIALFASPLSLLKIIPREMVPEPMGYFLMQYHNPSIEFRGPNPRMNVFSYVYFGIVYSPIYCFLIGVLTSFFRNRLFYLLPSNILGCIVYFLLLNSALKLEPDFHYALADFINIITILPFFVLISYYFSIKKTNEGKLTVVNNCSNI